MAHTGISDRIEETLYGILRFCIRFGRTLLALTFLPGKFYSRLTSLQKNKIIIAPYSFLIIGSYLFSILLNVNPGGGFESYTNMVWFTDEVASSIDESGAKLFSVSNAIISGIPIFLSLVVISKFYSWWFFHSQTHQERALIYTTSLYGLGYHLLFSAGSFIFFILLGASLDAIVDVNEASTNFTDFLVNLVLLTFLFSLIISYFVPVFFITRVRLSFMPSKSITKKISSFIYSNFLLFIAFVVMSFAGSLPANFKSVVSSTSTPSVSFIWIDDWVMKRDQTGNKTFLVRHGVFKNNLKKTDYLHPRKMSLEMEFTGGDNKVDMLTKNILICNEQGKNIPYVKSVYGETHVELVFELRDKSQNDLFSKLLSSQIENGNPSDEIYITGFFSNFKFFGSTWGERPNHSGVYLQLNDKGNNFSLPVSGCMSSN